MNRSSVGVGAVLFVQLAGDPEVERQSGWLIVGGIVTTTDAWWKNETVALRGLKLGKALTKLGNQCWQQPLLGDARNGKDAFKCGGRVCDASEPAAPDVEPVNTVVAVAEEGVAANGDGMNGH
ncbi:MAG TPA: hypothetical protein VF614_06460 [Chthoniobacteraceae bacterium]